MNLWKHFHLFLTALSVFLNSLKPMLGLIFSSYLVKSEKTRNLLHRFFFSKCCGTDIHPVWERTTLPTSAPVEAVYKYSTSGVEWGIAIKNIPLSGSYLPFKSSLSSGRFTPFQMRKISKLGFSSAVTLTMPTMLCAGGYTFYGYLAST